MKKIKKNVHGIEKSCTFAANMKEAYLQYNNQRVSSPILTNSVLILPPPCTIRCKSTICSLFRNVAADRKSGAFGVSDGFRGFRSFNGFRGFRGFRSFRESFSGTLMTLIDFNDFKIAIINKKFNR